MHSKKCNRSENVDRSNFAETLNCTITANLNGKTFKRVVQSLEQEGHWSVFDDNLQSKCLA